MIQTPVQNFTKIWEGHLERKFFTNWSLLQGMTHIKNDVRNIISSEMSNLYAKYLSIVRFIKKCMHIYLINFLWSFFTIHEVLWNTLLIAKSWGLQKSTRIERLHLPFTIFFFFFLILIWTFKGQGNHVFLLSFSLYIFYQFPLFFLCLPQKYQYFKKIIFAKNCKSIKRAAFKVALK